MDLIYFIITIMLSALGYVAYLFIINDTGGITTIMNDLLINNYGKLISLFGLLITLITYIVMRKKIVLAFGTGVSLLSGGLSSLIIVFII